MQLYFYLEHPLNSEVLSRYTIVLSPETPCEHRGPLQFFYHRYLMDLEVPSGMKGSWAVNYTGTQSLLTTVSYSLA